MLIDDASFLRDLPDLSFFDPATNTRQTIQYDAGSDRVVSHLSQDVSDILDYNVALQNERNGKMGDIEHVASVPITVQFEWMTKYGVDVFNPDHEEGVKRLLNSSDYRYLKTREIII